MVCLHHAVSVRFYKKLGDIYLLGNPCERMSQMEII